MATSATFISGGEKIYLDIPKTVSLKKQLVFPLKVLFEDEHLALIHKPAGILVSGNYFKTITNCLAKNIKRSTLPDATKPQPIHRLDYATTGILMIGKTRSSIRVLNQLFENKIITKTYYAVTIGEINIKGRITTAIDEKQSESHYEILESIASPRFTKLNLVRLEPKTGRRHQLRKHLASIGSPILGDKDYGLEGLILNGKGLYLHAYSLRFVHPFTKEDMHVTDAFPKRFEKLFASKIKDIESK